MHSGRLRNLELLQQPNLNNTWKVLYWTFQVNIYSFFNLFIQEERKKNIMLPAVFFDDSEFDIISDTVLNFGQGLRLLINTRLSYASQDGYKKPNIMQVRFDSESYKDYDSLVKVNRKIDCYLSLEYKPFGYDGLPNKIIIRDYSLIALRAILNDFYNEYFSKFKIHNNELILLPNNLRKNYSTYNGLYNIEFEPDIYYQDKNNPLSATYGVKIILNGTYIGIYRFEPSWLSFMYIVNTVNLFEYGSTVLNMFTMNRLGREVYDMKSRLMIDYYDKLIDSYPDNEIKNKNDNNKGMQGRRKDAFDKFFDG